MSTCNEIKAEYYFKTGKVEFEPISPRWTLLCLITSEIILDLDEIGKYKHYHNFNIFPGEEEIMSRWQDRFGQSLWLNEIIIYSLESRSVLGRIESQELSVWWENKDQAVCFSCFKGQSWGIVVNIMSIVSACADLSHCLNLIPHLELCRGQD